MKACDQLLRTTAGRLERPSRLNSRLRDSRAVHDLGEERKARIMSTCSVESISLVLVRVCYSIVDLTISLKGTRVIRRDLIGRGVIYRITKGTGQSLKTRI